MEMPFTERRRTGEGADSQRKNKNFNFGCVTCEVSVRSQAVNQINESGWGGEDASDKNSGVLILQMIFKENRWGWPSLQSEYRWTPIFIGQKD